jgi:hypothetical protein
MKIFHFQKTISGNTVVSALWQFFTSQIEKLPRKLFKGGNYSREETIRGNTVCTLYILYIPT